MRCAILLTAAFTLPCLAAEPVTLSSLLSEMNNRAAAARLPDPPYTCGQFSSYDRASKDPADATTWFANDDRGQMLRTEQITLPDGSTRAEFVLADCTGPGAIVRIWSPNPQGTLRVYIDGTSTPVLEADMTRLMSGKDRIGRPLAAEHSRGWNLYLPIPYAKSCKITTDKNDNLYYQVNYRSYTSDSLVEPFSADSLSRAKPEIDAACSSLLNPPVPAFNGPLVSRPLRSKELIELSSTAAHGIVNGFYVKIRAEDQAAALHDVILIADFDHEKTVWVPLGDFFGVTETTRPFRTHYLEYTADGRMISRFVMPYSRLARFRLQNLSEQECQVEFRIAVAPAEFSEKDMLFRATWHGESGIHTNAGAGTKDWNFAEITGNGRYVGDILTVFNPVKPWWGEGDEKIYVDGEKFPSHFGTGTEDYYGFGWCFQEPFVAPFNAQLRCDGYRPKGTSNNQGWTTLTRQRALDSIPFTSGIKFDMEVWHWAETDVRYSATTFSYARPGSSSNRGPDPAEASRPLPQLNILRVPGAMECERLSLRGKSAGVTLEEQDVSQYGARLWSEDTHLWIRAQNKGDAVDFLLPTDSPFPKQILVRPSRSWDYGIVQFYVDGEKAGEPIDLCSLKKGVAEPGEEISLGVHMTDSRSFVIRAELVGSNPAAEKPGTYFGIDYFRIIDR